jgi:hypothetical protein
MYKEIARIVDHNNFNSAKTISPYIMWGAESDTLNCVSKSTMQKYQKIYEENKNNKLQNNSTVHFSSLSSLPRYKYNNYITENKLNIKKVRSKDKINSLIISNSLINEYYMKTNNISKYYIVPTPMLKLSNPTTQEITAFLVREALIEEVKPVSPSLYADLIACDNFEGYFIRGIWGQTSAINNLTFFNEIVNKYDSASYNIVFDESINSDINQGLVLDDDTFQTLYNMLDSTNKENWSLAQEMIANCDVEISKPYILFLVWRFNHLKKINNNLNYKFCLKLLDKYKNIYYSGKIEYFISGIIKANPEFKQDMFNCFKIYLNIINKNNIIQEINIV